MLVIKKLYLERKFLPETTRDIYKLRKICEWGILAETDHPTDLSLFTEVGQSFLVH